MDASWSRIREEAGAAAVEFALVVVILVAVLLAVIQFGYTFFEYVSVAHAAREGARWASLGASADAVESHALSASPGLDPSRATITVDKPASDSVRVDVKYVRTVLVPVPDLVLPSSISSTAVLRVE